MHHDLDVHPIPKQPYYINEPELIDPSLCYHDPERKIPEDELKAYKAAQKYEDLRRFHKYPEAADDNIRVYIPMDLNAEAILRRLDEIIGKCGAASEYNESDYSSEVNRIISQLEIYDQVWFCRELKDGTSHFVGLAKESDVLAKDSVALDKNSEVLAKDSEAHDTEHDKSEEHSQHGLELVKKIIKRLEDIPDACAEMFPFSTIDELNKEWFGIETLTEPK